MTKRPNNFSNGITIAEPTGATFAEDYGVLKRQQDSSRRVGGVKERTFIPGDVNGDGQVSIGDIVAVTNVMAGIETAPATSARADVNGDTKVGIGDIGGITNIMAGGE